MSEYGYGNVYIPPGVQSTAYHTPTV